MPTPDLAIVVSTIGRPAQFRRLIDSVHASTVASRIEFVVVDQSDDRRSAAIVDEGLWNMAARAVFSGRGASVGRNAGLRVTSAPIVAFPDDDAWYPEGALEQLLGLFDLRPAAAGVCGRQVTADGRPSMLRWQATPGPVTSRNFLRTSIMSTMFFRRSWLDRVTARGADGEPAPGEPFDEAMGVGAQGWYGACEESDLLLRVLEAGGDIGYEPDLLICQDEPRDDPDDAFVTKMLKYGCGQGHLWRKRGLPQWQLAYFCARKLAAASVRASRGQRVLARADLAWLRGNIAGLRDVPPAALRPVAAAPAALQSAR